MYRCRFDAAMVLDGCGCSSGLWRDLMSRRSSCLALFLSIRICVSGCGADGAVFSMLVLVSESDVVLESSFCCLGSGVCFRRCCLLFCLLWYRLPPDLSACRIAWRYSGLVVGSWARLGLSGSKMLYLGGVRFWSSSVSESMSLVRLTLWKKFIILFGLFLCPSCVLFPICMWTG